MSRETVALGRTDPDGRGTQDAERALDNPLASTRVVPANGGAYRGRSTRLFGNASPSTDAHWIGRETPLDEWQPWDDPRRYNPGDPADVLDTAGLRNRLGPDDPELVLDTMDRSPSDLTDRGGATVLSRVTEIWLSRRHRRQEPAPR